MSEHIWAPELHYLFGKWYLYFAGGEKEDVWKIRPYVLECADEDPLAGTWKELGMMKRADEDEFSFTAFSLDATVFENKGNYYYVWAEKVGTGKQISNLYIAQMEAPDRLKTVQVLLTTPDYDWERIGFWVNEGPAVLKRDGKIYLTYSASETGICYCVGMLSVDEDADLLDPRQWKKERYPVLKTDEALGMQDTAEGHAVRAVYLYCAMADLAYEYQDEGLLHACEKLYDNIIKKRMYLTGGIGSSGAYERFTTDYDLPNDTNYAESCASIGLALFCRRMLAITGEEKYAETMECALMNTVTAGIALDGKSFFYVNPLEVWPDNCMDHTSMAHVKPVRQKWFGCACCPPNIARTLASLGEYVYAAEENDLWVNLFVGGEAEVSFGEIPVKAKVETRFPFEGKVKLTLTADKEVNGTIRLRIPSYADEISLSCDGKAVTAEAGSYAKIPFEGTKTEILLSFEMPPHFVYANPKVRADAGKVAVKRGPLVYCMEQTDNGENLSNLFVDTTVEPVVTYESGLLGGTDVIRLSGKRMDAEAWNSDVLYAEKRVPLKETDLTLVPYCYWGNRKTGEMQTWMKFLQ